MLKKYIIYIGYLLSFIIPFLFLLFLFIKFEIYQDRDNTTYLGPQPFIIYFFVISCISLSMFNAIIKNHAEMKIKIFSFLTILCGSTIAIILDLIIFYLIKFLNINLYEIIFTTIEVILFFAILTLLFHIHQNLDEYYKKYSLNLSFLFKKKNDKKNKKTSSKEAQILAAEVLIKVAKENNEPEMEKVGKDFLNKNK